MCFFWINKYKDRFRCNKTLRIEGRLDELELKEKVVHEKEENINELRERENIDHKKEEARITDAVNKMETFMTQIQTIDQRLRNQSKRYITEEDQAFHKKIEKEISAWNISGAVKYLENKVYSYASETNKSQAKVVDPLLRKLDLVMLKLETIKSNQQVKSSNSTANFTSFQNSSFPESSSFHNFTYNESVRVYKKDQISKMPSSIHINREDPPVSTTNNKEYNTLLLDLRAEFRGLEHFLNTSLSMQSKAIEGLTDVMNNSIKYNKNANEVSDTLLKHTKQPPPTPHYIDTPRNCLKTATKTTYSLAGGIDRTSYIYKIRDGNLKSCVAECCKETLCDIVLEESQLCYLINCKRKDNCVFTASPTASPNAGKITLLARYIDRMDNSEISAMFKTPTVVSGDLMKSNVQEHVSIIHSIQGPTSTDSMLNYVKGSSVLKEYHPIAKTSGQVVKPFKYSNNSSVNFIRPSDKTSESSRKPSGYMEAHILGMIGDITPLKLCKHTFPKAGLTIVGGFDSGGNHTSRGKMSDFKYCIKSCCKDPQCNMAFMIENYCYSLQCKPITNCHLVRSRNVQMRTLVSVMLSGSTYRSNPTAFQSLEHQPSKLTSTLTSTSTSPSTSTSTSPPTSTSTSTSAFTSTTSSNQNTGNKHNTGSNKADKIKKEMEKLIELISNKTDSSLKTSSSSYSQLKGRQAEEAALVSLLNNSLNNVDDNNNYRRHNQIADSSVGKGQIREASSRNATFNDVLNSMFGQHGRSTTTKRLTSPWVGNTNRINGSTLANTVAYSERFEPNRRVTTRENGPRWFDSNVRPTTTQPR